MLVAAAAKVKARPAARAAGAAAAAAPVLPRRRKAPFPHLRLRQWKGRMVAPIKPVLVAAIADTDHIERRYQRWATRVPNGFADRAPRRGCKKGGKPEFVATEAVLRWIYDHE